VPEREDDFRYLVFLLDGASDRPCPQLGGKTPLEAAQTPTFDHLARRGAQGLLETVPPECHPGSEVANLSILGYDPRTANPGRGVLEAASMGIRLHPNGVVFRVNLITVEVDLITDHSADHITSEEARVLLEYLEPGLQEALHEPGLRLHPGVSYRHVLTLEHGSSEVDCTPPHDILGRPWRDHLPRPRKPEAEETAQLLRLLIEYSQSLLAGHPVNKERRAAGLRPATSLWPWAPGKQPSLVPFARLHRMKGAVISAVDLIKGIGRLIGMTVIEVPGATGQPETNYEGKAEAAVQALKDHRFVYVHVEGVDEAGHTGDPDLKLRTIEYCDRRLVGRALSLLETEGASFKVRIAVLPDHATPCEIRTHDRSPVPLLLWGEGIEADRTSRFTEREAAGGRLGLRPGTDFLKLLTDRFRNK